MLFPSQNLLIPRKTTHTHTHRLEVRCRNRPIKHINHALGEFLSPFSTAAGPFGTTPTRARDLIDAAFCFGDAHLHGSLCTAERRAATVDGTAQGAAYTLAAR